MQIFIEFGWENIRIINFADLIDQLRTFDVDIISIVYSEHRMQLYIEFGWKNILNINFQGEIRDLLDEKSADYCVGQYINFDWLTSDNYFLFRV